ncbi:fanconi-associated nuclease 1 [Colossoma macropomum]|uniref:fanconi-associated nuclease 1 n=1 Tax=Colossoma macropomum TaxID=42526 RepID=UPI00186454A8|nr:fanconi-associated nuclease 1 [Colossoma macropomum]XP_036417628.1 fanconi-associated nuclease 1 [Colossoma macropomum]
MDSRAGRSQTKDHARPLKRLSLAKKDGQRGKAKENTSNKQKGLSITSFFKNTPPSKLACPLCGKLIPRYKINEHIDSQCQDFLEENDLEGSSASHNKQEKTTCPLPNNVPRSPDKKIDASLDRNNRDTKTSPYFKKNCFARSESPKANCQDKVVKTVSLGSLSSKLSRRALKFSENSKPNGEAEPNCSELSTSQKENCDENVSIKSAQMFPSEVATVNLPQVENTHRFEETAPKVESLSAEASQSVKTAAMFRLMKRRKEESPETCAASNLKKKSRYAGNKSKNATFPVVSQSQTSHVDAPFEVGKSELEDVERDQITPPDKSRDLPQEPSEVSVEPGLPKRPYYLQNFLTILEAVLENKDDMMLFNEEDLSSVHGFKKLSVPGQMLYVRLFQRKLKWLQVNKLDYSEIGSDLKPVVQELFCGGFLQTESELKDVQEVLDILPAPELRGLAKTFHLGGPGNSTQKQQLVEGLLRLAKQRSLFALAPGRNSTGAVILKRAKQLAGSCVRLSRGPRAVFSRALLLFSLTDTLEEEEMAAGGQGQLYTILLVNSGRLAFPAYTVQRSAQVFRDRDDLIRYEAAMRTLQEVITAMQAGSWEDALVLYSTAKATWQDLKQTCDWSCQEALPVFLRCFTVGWTYTRVLSRGVEILQRLRRYEDAVEELRSLLSQTVFCPDSRGRWWDRLALNLHQHLKQHEQAICAIRDGLMDPLVRTGHRLSLHQRAARMKESASFKKYRLLLRNLPSLHVQDVTHVTIRGQLFPHEGGMGKSVFLRPAAGDEGSVEGDNGMVICSVEELALAHYRKLGFDQGIHGEGSTFSTLFGLLMWDIIFMEGVPDVFRTPYQTCPLDFHTDSFYGNRQEAIEARAELLREASTETLQELLAEVWNSQEGRVCALVNWERFSSLQQAQSLVACLGGHFLSGVVIRMAKDYRHSRGGLPDLVIWNTSTNSYKLVEVKGPNDRLSQKQQLWLEELQKLGADVEVCHVTAIGARGTHLD